MTLTPEYWIAPDAWSDGDVRHYDIQTAPRDGYVAVIQVPYTGSNPYETDLVGESNSEAFGDIVAGAECDHAQEGPSGSWYVATDCDCEEIRDALASLSNYPILDDDDHSRRELEHADECWDDWGRHDVKRSLEAFHGIDLDDVSDEDFDGWVYDVTCHGWDHRSPICQDTGDDPSWDVRPWLADRGELLALDGAVDDDPHGETRAAWRAKAIEAARGAAQRAIQLGWGYPRVPDGWDAPGVRRLTRVYVAIARARGAS